jgi:hypothetical protein
MEKHDEPELRIMKVKGSLSAQQARRPIPPPLHRSVPTRAEALEGLRSIKGAASVIERLPALGNTSTWSETAFWSVCEIKGAAFDPYFWDCDFANNQFSVSFACENCILMFFGAEPLFNLEGITIIPPQNLSGQVWCDLNVSVPGTYLFVAQVGTQGDPGYNAIVEFCLDDSSLGERLLSGDTEYEQYSVLELAAGIHRFIIKQVSGMFYFRTLTAWNIPDVVLPIPEQ